MADRQIALARAEALIAAAIALLRPLCGLHVAVGVLEQMIQEQALSGIMDHADTSSVLRQPGGDPDANLDPDGRSARHASDEAPYLAAR